MNARQRIWRVNRVFLAAGMALSGALPACASSLRIVEGHHMRGFPTVPEFPEALLERSYNKEDAGRVGFEARWTTTARLIEVTSWYLHAFQEQGWTVLKRPDALDIAKSATLSATRGGITIMVIIEMDADAGKEPGIRIDVEIPLYAPTP